MRALKLTLLASPLAALAALAAPLAAQAVTVNFTTPCSAVPWQVPAGVTSIMVEAFGAQGGSAGGTLGGLGGSATATLAVTSGEQLQVNVGGQGGSPAGGCNGGGGGASGVSGSAGGGISVAGGGGPGTQFAPGAGGSPNGSSGIDSGGGGGSGFAIATATAVSMQSGVQAGNGLVRITYTLPTAVTFRSVSATAAAKGVLVRWRTASEIDTLGFHVYRALNGRRVRVDRKLVPARSASGRTYSYLDRRAPRSRALRYWIQVVNLDGSRQWYGPARVIPRNGS